MSTPEQKGWPCPRDRQDAQAQEGAIITGNPHSVFPRTCGKQRQGLWEARMRQDTCPARDGCGGFPQGESTGTFLLPEPTPQRMSDRKRVRRSRWNMKRARSLSHISGCEHISTVCPSHNTANMLSYQDLRTSIRVWRGQGQEAKRGEAIGQRITRNKQCLGCFSSRVWPPGYPRSRSST